MFPILESTGSEGMTRFSECDREAHSFYFFLAVGGCSAWQRSEQRGATSRASFSASLWGAGRNCEVCCEESKILISRKF